MNISVVGGTGYVGLCTGIGFAIKGHRVFLIGRDKKKVKYINNGKSPIFEPGVEEKLKILLKNGLVQASTNLKNSMENSDVSFICVGTPSKEDGSIDLTAIENVSKDVGFILKDIKTYHVVVIKSTVVPETTEKVVIPLLEKYSEKNAGKDFGICMNPEFLREGKALDDFLSPDRIVIGQIDTRSGDVLERLYKDFSAPILRTDLKTAEMIKYVSNALLATKISFSNEIGNICKKLGIDTYEVMRGVGFDKRIGPHFLDSGIGWGGSCFPKDVSAIIAKAKSLGYQPKILESVVKVNEEQPKRLIEMLKNRMDIKGKTISILGLSFKPDTDDVRESRAIPIIKMLMKEGVFIKAYDPKAMDNFKCIFPDIVYTTSIRDALKDSDACLILTDWEEFKRLKDEDFKVMRNNVILEGRRTLDRNKVSSFEGICW